MNTSVYNLGRYTTNPFVKAGLNIILDHGPDSCPLPELAAQLVAREPLLSPRNIECAAREALQKAQQEEAAPQRGRLDINNPSAARPRSAGCRWVTQPCFCRSLRPHE